jgi:hypothetical protein
MSSEPQIAMIGDEMVHWTIEFNAQAHVAETLRFVRTDGAHLYVDVDQDDIPVAVEFAQEDLQRECVQVAADDTDRQAHLQSMLFTFVSQLVWAKRLAQSSVADSRPSSKIDWTRIGDPLMRRTTDTIRQFIPTNGGPHDVAFA